MPDVETGWVDGLIPPLRFWRTEREWLGYPDGAWYNARHACLAAGNSSCFEFKRQFPADRDGNYQPLTVPQPADPADVSDGHSCHPYPNPDGDHLPGELAADRCGGNSDGTGAAAALRSDNRDSGRSREVPVADRNTGPATDTANVRDAHPKVVLHEGRLT